MTESSYCMTNLPQFCNSCMLPRELCRCMWRYDNKLQEKVSAIETRLKDLEEKIEDVIKLMVKEDSRLEDAAIKLEQKSNTINDNCDKLFEQGNLTVTRLNNLEKQLIAPFRKVTREEFEKEYPNVIERKPHKCPVCDGRGVISTPETIRFDIVIAQSSNYGVSACKSCEGKGLVWG